MSCKGWVRHAGLRFVEPPPPKVVLFEGVLHQRSILTLLGVSGSDGHGLRQMSAKTEGETGQCFLQFSLSLPSAESAFIFVCFLS